MLITQVKQDIDTARKEHNVFNLALLQTVYSDINMIGKNSLRETTDQEALSVIKKFIKGIDDTISLCTESVEHQLLKTKLLKEKELLIVYVPKQLTSDELINIIKTLIANGDNTLPLIMKALKEKYAGNYDGASASKITKELLER